MRPDGLQSVTWRGKGIRNSEVGRWNAENKKRRQGVSMRSNLILIVLVNQNFIGNEGRGRWQQLSLLAQRAKVAHLISVICTLKPLVELHEKTNL